MKQSFSADLCFVARIPDGFCLANRLNNVTNFYFNSEYFQENQGCYTRVRVNMMGIGMVAGDDCT